jgi:hypothetical protein
MNIFIIASYLLKRKRQKLFEQENTKNKPEYIFCPQIKEEANKKRCAKCKYSKKVSKDGKYHYLCDYQ